MPSRGSGFEVAVSRTTLSPILTTAAPWACLASFPVSNESCLPPARSTVTVLTSGFIFHPFIVITSCDQESGRAFLVASCKRCGLPDSWRIGRRVHGRMDAMRAECPYVRTLELAQCCSGFKRKAAVLRESVQESFFFRRSLGGCLIVPTFSQKR